MISKKAMWAALILLTVTVTYLILIWFSGFGRRPEGGGLRADDAPTHPELVPGDVPALRRLEARFRRVTEDVRPAVVAVMNLEQALRRQEGPYAEAASGVIISPEGLVLTQWHVSHAKKTSIGTFDPYDPGGGHRPGETTTVVMHDGSTRGAELLGAMPAYDLGTGRK